MAEDEKEVHAEGEGAVGEGRDGGEDPGDGGDGSCAEACLGGTGDAESCEDNAEGEEGGAATTVKDQFFNWRGRIELGQRFVFHRREILYHIFGQRC